MDGGTATIGFHGVVRFIVAYFSSRYEFVQELTTTHSFLSLIPRTPKATPRATPTTLSSADFAMFEPSGGTNSLGNL